MSKRKILIIALAVLGVVGYAGYSFAMPKKIAHQKVDGTVYVLPKAFTLNLRDGRYATLTAALVLAPGQSTGAAGEGSAPPPDGFGPLPEEAVIRDIITNVVTDQTAKALVSPTGRSEIKRQVLRAITSGTDVKVADVLFTDVAVQ